MGIIGTILLGALVGWLASIVTKRDAEQGALANIAVGIVGALLASWLLGRGALEFSLESLAFAFLGAIILCVAINLVTRRRVR